MGTNCTVSAGGDSLPADVVVELITTGLLLSRLKPLTSMINRKAPFLSLHAKLICCPACACCAASEPIADVNIRDTANDAVITFRNFISDPFLAVCGWIHVPGVGLRGTIGPPHEGQSQRSAPNWRRFVPIREIQETSGKSEFAGLLYILLSRRYGPLACWGLRRLALL